MALRSHYSACITNKIAVFLYLCAPKKKRKNKQCTVVLVDSDEAQKIMEWRAQASKELEDWYKHRNEQLDKAKSSNRCVTGTSSNRCVTGTSSSTRQRAATGASRDRAARQGNVQ